MRQFWSVELVDLVPCKSSKVSAFGHDPETGELHVQYKDGATYAFEGVPADLHDSLRNAPSVGSFLHREIERKHKARKVA